MRSKVVCDQCGTLLAGDHKIFATVLEVGTWQFCFPRLRTILLESVPFFFCGVVEVCFGMPVTTPTPESIALRPETFRLPKPGTGDPYWGFSRSFYYQAEARGWLKLIRICDAGKQRGITLVPYRAVEELVLVRSQAKEPAR